MSKGWYVKVDTQVVFNVDTNIGVVAETEEKAGLEAQKIVSERLDRHGYKDVLEKGLPCDIEMGGAIWHRGAETADIEFDTMQVWSVTQDSDFDPDSEEMTIEEVFSALAKADLDAELIEVFDEDSVIWVKIDNVNTTGEGEKEEGNNE